MAHASQLRSMLNEALSQNPSSSPGSAPGSRQHSKSHASYTSHVHRHAHNQSKERFETASASRAGAGARVGVGTSGLDADAVLDDDVLAQVLQAQASGDPEALRRSKAKLLESMLGNLNMNKEAATPATTTTTTTTDARNRNAGGSGSGAGAGLDSADDDIREILRRNNLASAGADGIKSLSRNSKVSFLFEKSHYLESMILIVHTVDRRSFIFLDTRYQVGRRRLQPEPRRVREQAELLQYALPLQWRGGRRRQWIGAQVFECQWRLEVFLAGLATLRQVRLKQVL